MNLPACNRCGERVMVSTTLLASLTVTDRGVATLYVATDLLGEIDGDAIRCGCQEREWDLAPDLTDEQYTQLSAVVDYVQAHCAPEVDLSLPDEDEVAV